MNPYNDLPTVRLLDPAGAELQRISQREAARLLRGGAVEVVFTLPATVRLLIAAEEYEALRHCPADDETLKAKFLHARRGVLYGNVRFVNPAGEVMFHADQEKALWYLNRGLVEVIATDPPTLRFAFAPGGPGHVGDDYYLAGKENRCVVCGAAEMLNRHHVVPSVYRRHLPSEMKDHSHHDVLLLCLACHEKYEAAADELKTELGREHGVPLHGLHPPRDERLARAAKAARALAWHAERMPQARRDALLSVLREWLGREPAKEDIEALAELEQPRSGVEHGAIVVANTPDLQAFVRRWREHFVRAMRPAHLPAYWDVDRPG